MTMPAKNIIVSLSSVSDEDVANILAAVVRECKKRKTFRSIKVSEVVAQLEGSNNESSS